MEICHGVEIRPCYYFGLRFLLGLLHEKTDGPREKNRYPPILPNSISEKGESAFIYIKMTLV